MGKYNWNLYLNQLILNPNILDLGLNHMVWIPLGAYLVSVVLINRTCPKYLIVYLGCILFLTKYLLLMTYLLL